MSFVRNGLVAAPALAIAALMAGSSSAADVTPFASLAGSWSGAGQIRLEGGKYENIRCRAFYTLPEKEKLGMAIRCASSSNKIEMRASLTYANGKVTGDWEERTFNAAGNVAGTTSGSHMTLNIEGGGLTGSLAVRLGEKSQLVSISTEGSAFRGLSLSLTRG
ncbi:MAG: hypothetical protein ACK4MF_11610 [Hyphomicrobiaceae bacterium]